MFCFIYYRNPYPAETKSGFRHQYSVSPARQDSISNCNWIGQFLFFIISKIGNGEFQIWTMDQSIYEMQQAMC